MIKHYSCDELGRINIEVGFPEALIEFSKKGADGVLCSNFDLFPQRIVDVYPTSLRFQSGCDTVLSHPESQGLENELRVSASVKMVKTEAGWSISSQGIATLILDSTAHRIGLEVTGTAFELEDPDLDCA